MRRLAALALAAIVLAAVPAARGDRAVAVKRSAGDAPSRGPRNAAVTLELFCDHLQAHCATLLPNVVALAERHPERLRVIYRQLPANAAHNRAFAELVLEAHAQGKLAELLAAAYTLRPPQRREVTVVAKRAGLDAVAVEAALADGRHRPQLEDDRVWAARFDVSAAPAVVVNGRAVRRVSTLDDLEAEYDLAYAHARDLLGDGVPPRKIYATVRAEAARERVAQVTGRKPQASGESEETDAAIDLAAARVNVATEGAPALGPEGADVVVVVFGDYQCPHCRKLMATLAQVEEVFGERVRIVFRHAPVDSHRDALLAARAAACAQAQGKFWEYHALLFRNWTRLGEEALVRYAREVGLDVEQFVSDLQAGRCDARVEADVADARALGFYGTTPVTFVNGLKLVGARTFSELQLVIEEELRPGLLGGIED